MHYLGKCEPEKLHLSTKTLLVAFQPNTKTDSNYHFVITKPGRLKAVYMRTLPGLMDCGKAGPFGLVPGVLTHLQGDQVN